MSKKISVILPSYLSNYQGSASNRSDKLRRAINSFLEQSHNEKELIVISDGCIPTIEVVEKNYRQHLDSRLIKLIKIEKQPMFSGNVREVGLQNSTGDIICYLDSDDIISGNHLSSIVNAFQSDNNISWVYFNDFIKYLHLEHIKPTERNVQIESGTIGTSSIAHLNIKELSWTNCDNYGHDFHFISRLLARYPNYKKIDGCSYIVCHIPNTCDS
jgi:glycosyltransferase involved in cell wall biosynthesis